MKITRARQDKIAEWFRERKKLALFLQITYFVAFSFLQFAVMELYFDVNCLVYTTEILWKNVLIFILFNLILVCIFHSMRFGLMLSQMFFLLVGIANFFVISFRGYGIVFMDFYAAKTAAGVADGYTYRINSLFVAAVLAGIALLMLCLLLPRRKHSYLYGKHVLTSLLGMAVSLFFVFWINYDVVFFKDISGLTWDHQIGMTKYGYVLYFTSNAGKASVDEPVGYSVEKADEILSRYEVKNVATQQTTNSSQGAESDTGKEDATVKSPNLIMIMNESFADLEVLGNLKTSEDVLSFYHSLEKNTIKGYAESSVYGGYTSNSEFEFLTGCTKAFLPGNPYLQYIDDTMPSFVTKLKEQSAYQEVIAMHPYKPSGYNRNRVYPLLGFDQFLSLEDFSQKNLVRSYVSDEENYKKIEALYEKKKAGESLCVFNVTMQNHNPYDTKYNFTNPVTVTNFNPTYTTEEYLSLMKLSDDALKNLVTYFEKEEEPTMIVLFGDHQPHLSNSFYKHVTGTFPELFSQEQTMAKHMVPFMIWANYDIEEETIDRTSINYLSTLVEKTAGLEMSDYDRFLLDMQKKIPSISASGYYDEKGNLYDYSSEEENEYTKLLQEYEIVQYNYLFGGKERLDHHFEASSASRTALDN